MKAFLLVLIVFFGSILNVHSESINLNDYPYRRYKDVRIFDGYITCDSINIIKNDFINYTETINLLMSEYPKSGNQEISLDILFDPSICEYSITNELKEQQYKLVIDNSKILISSKSFQGVINALATLSEIASFTNNLLTFPNIEINDFPSTNIRYVSEYFVPSDSYVKFAIKERINGIAISYRYNLLIEDEIYNEKRLSELLRLKIWKEKTGYFSIMLQYHIAGRGGSIVDIFNERYRKKVIERIINEVELSSADDLLIAHDDIYPFNLFDQIYEPETIAKLHISFLEQIEAEIIKRNLNTKISFVSPFYQGLAYKKWKEPEYLRYASRYFNEFSDWENTSISIVWTGPVTESLNIKEIDMYLYHKLLGMQHPLFYWDNTWHYSQPIRYFKAGYFKNFISTDKPTDILLYINADTYIGRFFAKSAMNYYWNPDTFNEKISLDYTIKELLSTEALPVVHDYLEVRNKYLYMTNFLRFGDKKEALKYLEELYNLDKHNPYSQEFLSRYSNLIKK